MVTSFGLLRGSYHLPRDPFRRETVADPMQQFGFRVGLDSARISAPPLDDLEIIVPEEDEGGENAVRPVQRPGFRKLFIERSVKANTLNQFGFRVGGQGTSGTGPDYDDLQVLVQDEDGEEESEHSPDVGQRSTFTGMFSRGLGANPLLRVGLDSRNHGQRGWLDQGAPHGDTNFDDDLQVVDTDDENSRPRLMERRTAFRRLHHHKSHGCTNRGQRARRN